MTFTVLAHSAETGETGFGITTASISCGGHLPTHTLDGDIVISQAFTRPEDGLVAAREVGAGGDWPAVLRAVDASDPFMRYRQLGTGSWVQSWRMESATASRAPSAADSQATRWNTTQRVTACSCWGTVCTAKRCWMRC